MRVPDSFRVLGQRFTVRIVDRDTSAFHGCSATAVGATDLNQQLVSLRAVGLGGVSEHQQVETFLHESLHAIFYQGHLRPFVRHGEDEQVISGLAPQLLDYLRSNPEAVKYLMQPLP